MVFMPSDTERRLKRRTMEEVRVSGVRHASKAIHTKPRQKPRRHSTGKGHHWHDFCVLSHWQQMLSVAINKAAQGRCYPASGQSTQGETKAATSESGEPTCPLLLLLLSRSKHVSFSSSLAVARYDSRERTGQGKGAKL